MLCRLEIDNFKTLNQFQMEFSPLTVVVGNNASGKSTVLQVLDLLCSSVQEDFSSILARRGWNVSDLRSKCRNKLSSRLVISADFELMVEGERREGPTDYGQMERRMGSFQTFFEDFRQLYES